MQLQDNRYNVSLFSFIMIYLVFPNELNLNIHLQKNVLPPQTANAIKVVQFSILFDLVPVQKSN